MASLASPHALDLTTPETRTVRIDGVPYILRDGDHLSFTEWKDVARAWNRLLAIESLATPTPADDTEAMALLACGVTRALEGLPEDVLARLGYVKRSQIFATFITLSGSGLAFVRAAPQDETPAPTLPEMPATPPPVDSPGTKSSRGSSASTAATRPRGKRASHLA